MRAHRSAWLVLALLLAGCGAHQAASTTGLTVPDAGRGRPGPTTTWTPVPPPAALSSVVAAYYDGAGPAPEDEPDGRPSCLLLLPTSVAGTGLAPEPTSAFNVFAQYVVRWQLPGHTTGLTLSVYVPGDPSDRPFFAPTATVSPLPGGAVVRTTPELPRAVLILIPNENCEYELQPGARLPASADASLLASLRVVDAP
ncbi:MAG TPA: hypothetical protein VGU73_11420 [Acidimicrobiia bacterium]|nr:hypothetical protein [Acidimicrobiia bacterium]